MDSIDRKLQSMQRSSIRSALIQPGPNLTEQVTAMLKRQITGGAYDKGDLLPSEQSLAVSFGVSRAVIREAVSRLKADGLVITRQGRGAYVSSTIGQQSFQISGDSADGHEGINKILELRMSLEVEAAGLAALRRESKHLREMQKALDGMAKAVAEGSVVRTVKADRRFHESICVATDNPHFLDFFNFLSPFLNTALTVTRRNSMKRLGRTDEVAAEHQAIFDAIEAGDSEAARLGARQHISNTMNRLASLGTDG